MDDEFDARLRQALRDRAEQAGRPDDVFGELRRRSARRRRRQHLAVSVAALVVLAVPAVGGLSRLLPDGDQEVLMGEGNTLEVEEPPPGQTVEVPPRGTAQGTTFDDGTPVLVVHDAKGEVRVFHARSSLDDEGRRGQLGWCESGSLDGQLVDSATDRQWRPDGSPVVIDSDEGSPGAGRQSEVPPPLVAYAVEGEAEDGEVGVGDPRPVEAEPSIIAESPRGPGPVAPAACPPGEVVSPPLPGEAADVAELDELPDGTYRVSATLEQVGDGQARLCATPDELDEDHGPLGPGPLTPPPPADLELPVCGDDAVAVPGDEVMYHSGDPHLAHLRSGEFSVSVRDGAVETLLVSASSMSPTAAPVEGELVFAGSLVSADENPGDEPPPPPEPDDSGPAGRPVSPDHPVPLPPSIVGEGGREDHGPAVGLTDHEVVEGPDWFVEDPPYPPGGEPPDFRLPLASDADITVDGESLDRDEFISQVEDGDLEGHEVTVTVDRASGRTVEVRSRDG